MQGRGLVAKSMGEPSATPDKAPDAKAQSKTDGGSLAAERMRAALSVGSVTALIREVTANGLNERLVGSEARVADRHRPGGIGSDIAATLAP